jgi:D-alanyl-D-alanine carboxypeptidase
MDDTGRVLWARAASDARPNASTTKMVTALTLRRVYRLDLRDRVEVSEHAAATGGGGLDLASHDAYRARGLLLALLLTSSNDAAVALAEHAAGRERAFVVAMNRVAAELGARRSHFVTPHGLDAPGHYSSARDLADIAAVLLADPVLADIVATPSASIDGPEGTILLDNRNSLLESYRGAIGVKTGYTLGAGNVLVGAATRRGRMLISVAMDSVNATVDTQQLLDHGFARLRRTVLVRAGAPIGGIIPPLGRGVAVVAADAFRGPWERAEIDLLFEPAAELTSSVTAGERVGDVVVVRAGRPVGKVAALAADDASRDDVPWIVEVLLAVVGQLAGVVGRGA